MAPVLLKMRHSLACYCGSGKLWKSPKNLIFGNEWASISKPFSSISAMRNIVGINLGTTNSCVAMLEGKDVKVIKNSEGTHTIPSVVTYRDKQEILVGKPAMNDALQNPKSTFFGTKRMLGRLFEDSSVQTKMNTVPYTIEKASNGDAWIEANKQQFSPSQIVAHVLTKLKDAAEAYVGRTISEAVISVPSYANCVQRRATVDAGRLARLDVKILSDPIAAALWWYVSHDKEEGHYAIVNLGGGGSDVSIVEFSHKYSFIRPIVSDGSDSLGGEDFDNAIVEYLLLKLKLTMGIDLKEKDSSAEKHKEYLSTLQRLWVVSEKAKIELSSKCQTEIKLPLNDRDWTCSLNRPLFENLVYFFTENIRDLCKRCLNNAAKLGVSDLKGVILLGGMSRVPILQSVVAEVFNKNLIIPENSEEIVAVGAALRSRKRFDNILLDINKITHHIYIEDMFRFGYHLFEINETMPQGKLLTFSTVEDNQDTITVRLFFGNNFWMDRKFCEFELSGFPQLPQGTPQIKLLFAMDLNGCLTVRAQDKSISIKPILSGWVHEDGVLHV